MVWIRIRKITIVNILGQAGLFKAGAP